MKQERGCGLKRVDSGAEPEQTHSTGQSQGKGSLGKKGNLRVIGLKSMADLEQNTFLKGGCGAHRECLKTCSQKTVSAAEGRGWPFPLHC